MDMTTEDSMSSDPMHTSLNFPNDRFEIRDQILVSLRDCYDPEIPVNIYDLGLIYRIEMDDNGAVVVEMTLTSPNCPVAESLPIDIEQRIQAVPGVQSVDLSVVWDPPWEKDMMTDDAKFQLNIF